MTKKTGIDTTKIPVAFWTVCDKLRSAGLESSKLVNELVRLGLALEHSTAIGSKLSPDSLLSILNDPGLNREWGFATFFPLSAKQLGEIEDLESLIKSGFYRDGVAALLKSEAIHLYSDFPLPVFELITKHLELKKRTRVLVPPG